MEKFETVTRIGKGACGAVFLVRNQTDKKLYALKKIQLDESRKNRTKDAVLREARILAKLKHVNIVAYHDSFFDEDNLCIIQDYCDGGTLEDKILEASQKRMHFDEKQVMQWFIQLTMAVNYMHSMKVLHRDLKSQNVLMTKANNTCKLGDFGISKMMDQTIDVAKTCVGTPCYLAPEMCQDIPYTSKADVWALGCLLYEMCALHPAFDANNLISLFYKIVKAEYEPIPSQYSSNLSNILKVVLVKNPDCRLSARQILVLPYVREALGEFIEEKQYEQQMKNAESSSPRKSQDNHPQKTHQNDHSSKGDPAGSSTSRDRVIPRLNFDVCSPSGDGSGSDSSEGAQVSPGPQQKFVCKQCGKQFAMRSWLQKHVVQKHQVFAAPLSARSPTRNISAQLKAELSQPQIMPTSGDTDRGKLSPQQMRVQNDPEDYEDDFETADPEPSNNDFEHTQYSDEEIPEELSEEGESESEIASDYIDDFEEEEEELDDLVCQAQQAHRIRPRGSDSDDTVVDDMVSMVISNCKLYLQEQCLTTLNSDPRSRHQQKHNQSTNSRITEEDLSSKPEVLHQFKSRHKETCYLIEELFQQDQT